MFTTAALDLLLEEEKQWRRGDEGTNSWALPVVVVCFSSCSFWPFPRPQQEKNFREIHIGSIFYSSKGLVDSLQMPGKPRDRISAGSLSSLSLSLSLCGEMICCSSTSNPNQTLIQSPSRKWALVVAGKKCHPRSYGQQLWCSRRPFHVICSLSWGKKQYYNEGRKRLTKILMFIFNCCKKTPSRWVCFLPLIRSQFFISHAISGVQILYEGFSLAELNCFF